MYYICTYVILIIFINLTKPLVMNTFKSVVPLLLLAFLCLGKSPSFSANAKTKIKSATDTAQVFAPVIVKKAPTNEASIITIDGKHKIFFINRPGPADQMMSETSVDGLSWEAPKVEFKLPGTSYYANQVLVDEKGTIHCVYHLWSKGDKGYRGRQLDLWYTRKKKGDAEWEKSRMIFVGYVGSHRNFMQLKSGRLVMSFAKAIPGKDFKPKDTKEVDFGFHETVSLYSDDNGESWKESNGIKIQIDPNKATRYGAIEPTAIQLNNGKLWMLIRTNNGMLYDSFSADNGTTWSNPSPSSFISSDSPAHFLKLRDGRLVVIFNMSQRWDIPNSYAFGGREVLHAAISSDDGKTWKGFREVLRTHSTRKKGVRGDSGSAYPSAIENKDGKIVMVSGQGEDGAVVVFDPNWLTSYDSKIDAKTSENWTLFGYEGTVKKNLKPNGVEFKADTAGLAFEAVWNFAATTKGELSMQIQSLNKGNEFRMALTDHFSISSDTAAYKQAMFSFDLGKQNKNGAIIPVTIKWDLKLGVAKVYIANKEKYNLKINKKSAFGINYLRLGVHNANKKELLGFLVKSAVVKSEK